MSVRFTAKVRALTMTRVWARNRATMRARARVRIRVKPRARTRTRDRDRVRAWVSFRVSVRARNWARF